MISPNPRQIYNNILTIVDGSVFFLCIVADVSLFFDIFAPKYTARNETFITDSFYSLNAAGWVW